MMTRTVLLSTLLALALVVAGCQSETSSTTSTSNAENPPTETASSESMSSDDASSDAEWGYTGDKGPEQWAELDEAYSECSGSMQSPIDLSSTDEIDAADVALDYESATGTLTDTGHGVQVSIEGGTLTYDGKTYALKQFHFHTPSEHTVEGRSYDAEVHLVHAADDGTLAVLGLFYEEGEANDFLAPVWSGLSDLESADPVTVNVVNMLPDDRTTFAYDGSLTTPPCSETVSWFVMREPLTMSADQLDALTALYDDNNRPVQPLNDREVERVRL